MYASLDIWSKARMKILQKETRTAMEEYKEAHQEPHKTCRNNRKE